MNIIRATIITSVLLISYSMVVLVSMSPWLAILAIVLIFARKRHHTLTAFGTARWADEQKYEYAVYG